MDTSGRGEKFARRLGRARWVGSSIMASVDTGHRAPHPVASQPATLLGPSPAAAQPGTARPGPLEREDEPGLSEDL